MAEDRPQIAPDGKGFLVSGGGQRPVEPEGRVAHPALPKAAIVCSLVALLTGFAVGFYCSGSTSNGPEFQATKRNLTDGEKKYWEHARDWGLTEVQFDRLRLAWTVTRRSDDSDLIKVVGVDLTRQMGKTILERLSLAGDAVSQNGIAVDRMYREMCAEILSEIGDLEREKRMVNLWLEVMKV